MTDNDTENSFPSEPINIVIVSFQSKPVIETITIVKALFHIKLKILT